MRLMLVAGTTRTAAIDGISAAGATAELRWHTPSADAELVRLGRLVRAPVFPRSPTGCPTPALVTRAVGDLLDLDVVVADGGLAKPTGAPTVGFGAKPGRDIRDPDPVPTAPGAFAAAEAFATRLDDDHLVVGETIPGGTTTALATMCALG
jgi:NaMN:DMB phosphoribosyltransferase